MGRGPYEKSGILQDNALPPLRTVSSVFDIFFPVKEEENDDGETVRTFPSDHLTIEVKLWYLPYGTMDQEPFLWFEEKRTVKISAGY